ncbi:hypothetical protein [Actomonas aquatica]|uniref:Uncharacterized protein n=1 Tax=Actomonas aquatica TaxID=2866162 RepID=A0ABZ1C988_9BACT|nr:hypothetical protein [Opitutus sp. WL0086]WRQ86880.1 hypothetical protein K1X11_018870 [Opitutus sp. WL0086]
MTSEPSQRLALGLHTPTTRCYLSDEAIDPALGRGPLRLEPAPPPVSDPSAPAPTTVPADCPLLVDTGRDRLTLSDLRRTSSTTMSVASARLTGFGEWLNCVAPSADVDAMRAGAAHASPLWLATAISLRQQAMDAGRPIWLWALGLDDSQLVKLCPDGRVHLEEVPTGINRLIDLVQRDLDLHFRSSAFDLMFNEDFDWTEFPSTILDDLVAPLRMSLGHHTDGQVLAILGLGPRLGPLTAQIARVVNMITWAPPIAAPGTHHPASLDSWILQQIAAPTDGPALIHTTYDGAPLLLPYPEPEGASTSTAESSSSTAERPDSTAAGTTPPRRRRRRGVRRWVRHHSSKVSSPRADESQLRKTLFVVLYVVVVAIAGHLIVDQLTEQAREQRVP